MKVKDFTELEQKYPRLAHKAKRLCILRCLIEMREVGFKKDYKDNLLLWDLFCLVNYFNDDKEALAMKSFKQWSKCGQLINLSNFYIIQTWKRVLPRVKALKKEYVCLTK